MEVLKIDDFKGMVELALTNITARADEFSQLDAVAGDGDHGTAIVAALTAIVNAGKNSEEYATMLMDMSMGAMAESCGSTSTLIGAFFMGMGDVALGETLTSTLLKDAFKAGLTGVQEQTKAQKGDKTMMDALIPAVEAMMECNGNIGELLEVAAEAANKGAEATKEMQAKFGRARNLGERSVGSADPGASSWACMFSSFADYTKEMVN